MEYVSEARKQLEDRLSYLLEILRKELILKTNYEITFDVIKIVAFRLVAMSNQSIKDEWRKFCFEIENRRLEYISIDRFIESISDMNSSYYYNRLFVKYGGIKKFYA